MVKEAKAAPRQAALNAIAIAFISLLHKLLTSLRQHYAIEVASPKMN